MKKIVLFFAMIIIVISGISYIFLNYKANYNISKKANLEFENYLNVEVSGTDLVTVMNRAIDNNEKKWTVYDVITAAGYARENNKYYTDDESDGKVDNSYFENNYKITVRFESINGTTDNLQNYDTSYYNKAIQDEQKNVTELPKYSCIITYHDNGRVKSLTFKK